MTTPTPGQTTLRVSVTPTVTAATYAANKVVGGIIPVPVLPLYANYGGILQTITLKFKASLQTVGFYVALFDTSPGGTFTDTNTAAIASGDSAYLLGVYSLSGGVSVLGTHTVYTLDGIGEVINGQSANLYAVIVPGATTVALASTSDVTLSLGVLQG